MNIEKFTELVEKCKEGELTDYMEQDALKEELLELRKFTHVDFTLDRSNMIVKEPETLEGLREKELIELEEDIKKLESDSLTEEERKKIELKILINRLILGAPSEPFKNIIQNKNNQELSHFEEDLDNYDKENLTKAEEREIEEKIRILRNSFGLSSKIPNAKERLEKQEKNLVDQYEKNKVRLEEFRQQYDNSLDYDLVGDDSILMKIRELEKLQRSLLNEIRELRERIKEFDIAREENKISNSNLDNKVETTKVDNTDINISVDERDTEPLPIIKEEKKEDIKVDIRSVAPHFNAKDGRYEIIFKEINSNNYKTKIYPIHREFLDKNSREFNEYSSKYGNKKDYSWICAFEEFDKEYGTTLKDSYLDNKLDITYDMRQKYKNVSKYALNSKEKRQFNKNIKKYDCKDIIRTDKKAQIKYGVAIAGLSAGVVSGAGYIINDTLERAKDAPKITTESPIDMVSNTEPTVTTEKNDMVINTEDKTVVVNDQNKTTEKITDNKTTEENKQEQNKVQEEPKNDKVVEESYNNDHRINDKIDLNNINYYATVYDKEPTKNINEINCDNYTINRIVVKYGDKLIKINTNNYSIESLMDKYQKYGPDVEIWFNINGENPNYKDIGWINANDYFNNNLENAKTK